MKRNPLSGVGRVYAFSLKNTCFSKGWLTSTLIMVGLLLFGIPLLFWGISKLAADDDKDSTKTKITTVAVVDETAGTADYTALNEGSYAEVSYLTAATVEEAAEAIKGNAYAVILHVTRPEKNYSLTVYLPEKTEISRSKASKYADFVSDHFSALLMQKAELDSETVALLSQNINTDTAELKHEGGETADEDEDSLQEVLDIMLPFMMMMLIYMMVIFYGQSMSNSVLLEKTSKLMETMLTAVHPVALLTGKLFATATAAVIQIVIWIIAGTVGMLAGMIFLLKMLLTGGGSDLMPVSTGMDSSMTAAMEQMMSSGNVPVLHIGGLFGALVMLALGFLLYLSLSGLSGAMASKTEDVNKTQLIFVFVLLGSMMLCLNFDAGDSMDVSLVSTAPWLNYFPFTALLLVPGRMILGTVSAGTAIASLLIMAVAVAVFVGISAAVYKLLVLYRGAPPTPAKLIAMLKESKAKKQETKTE